MATASDSAATSVRTCKKLIRFSPAELATVNERARSAGQPVACYIRDVAIGSRKRSVASAIVGDAMIRELARAATQLCSLRDSALESALPAAGAFAAAVDDVLALIRRIE